MLMRVVRSLIILTVLSGVFLFLWQKSDVVRIEFSSYAIEVRSFILITFLIIFQLLLYKFSNILSWIYGLPSKIYGYFVVRKDINNIYQLLEGYKNLVNEDVAELRKNISSLEKSAVMDIHFKQYIPYYKALKIYWYILESNYDLAEKDLLLMLTNKDSKLFALKNLIKVKIEDSNYKIAHDYAVDAWNLKCREKWLFEAFIKIHEELCNYEELEEVLLGAKNLKFFDSKLLDRKLVSCYFDWAKYYLASTKTEKSIDLLQKALRIENNNIDIALLLIQAFLITEGEEVAFTVLEKIYYYNPDPKLIQEVISIYKSNSLDFSLDKIDKLLSMKCTRESLEWIIAVLANSKETEKQNKYIAMLNNL